MLLKVYLSKKKNHSGRRGAETGAFINQEDVKAGRCGGYTKEEFLRVEETLRYQAGKYLYMFGES